MSRRLRSQRRADKASFDEVCSSAATAFGERRFDDALAAYQAYQAAHPDSHKEQIEVKISALQSYITDHVEQSKFFEKQETN